LSYCQTFESVVKDHGCSSGIYNTILEEIEQGFHIVSVAHVSSHTVNQDSLAGH